MGIAGRAARYAGYLGIAGLVAALALWRWAAPDPVTDKVEGALLDLRFQLRGPLPAPESVTIVAIDERDLTEIGSHGPLRAALARALATIFAAGPRAIAIDILLAEATASDSALAAAIDAAGPVLLAVAATGTAAGPRRLSPEQEAALTRSALAVVIGPPASAEPPELLLPAAPLVGAGELAHVNVAAGEDAAVRALPLAIPVGDGRLLPSMALAAARDALGLARDDVVYRRGGAYRVGGQAILPDERGRMLLDHYGPAGTVPTIRLQDVLDGRAPAAAFADRVVFIGSTAPSLRDDFATPFGKATAGVEILATAAANIVEGRRIGRDPAAFGLTALLGIAAGVLAAAAFHMRRLALALAGGLAVWAAAAVALQLAFAHAGLWLDGVTVLGGLVAGTGAGLWSRLGREQRGRSNLAQYVPPSLADHLSDSARPGFDGHEHDAGLLFVDVAGYSGLVESRPPAEIAEFLRELHRLFEAAAEAHGGLIVDYQGDGALMVFGLPEPGARDAANALACAETLLAGRRSVRAGFLAEPVSLRVSVHWGPVACAVLGGRRHAQVSVTGDAVNVTARLQEFAKAHGAALVATRAALDAGGATHGLHLLGREPLRGRRREIEIWGRETD